MPVVIASGSRLRGWSPPVTPGWFTSMADKTWATPVTNTLADVAPSPNPGGSQGAICTAWTGGYADQVRGEYGLSANGGHADYAGNETYAVALRQASPAWVRVIETSANEDIDTDGSLGGLSSHGINSIARYADGRMRSAHGWQRQCFGNGYIWHCGVSGMYASGQRSSACWKIDRATGAHSYLGQGLASPGGGNIDLEAGPSCYDSVRNCVWSACGQGASGGGKSFWKVDCATDAITEITLGLGDFGNGTPRWSVCAPDLGLWILGATQGYLLVADVSSGSVSTFAQITPTGTPTAYGDGTGVVYHAASRALLCWDGYGTALRKLAIPADPFEDDWTWSEVTAESGGATPSSAPTNGTYSKFNIIEDMGNGQSALCVVNAVDEPVYVYKLPAGGV